LSDTKRGTGRPEGPRLAFSGEIEAVTVASEADLACESNFGPKRDQTIPPATVMQAKANKADPTRLFPEVFFAMIPGVPYCGGRHDESTSYI
jgi:hypothetical protein